jgi:hypothetical protein
MTGEQDETEVAQVAVNSMKVTMALALKALAEAEMEQPGGAAAAWYSRQTDYGPANNHAAAEGYEIR